MVFNLKISKKNKYEEKYYFMAMIILATSHVGAQEANLVGKVFEHTLLRDGMNASVFLNPAMQSFHYQHSLNTLNVGYDYRHATTPERWEEGDGHSRVLLMWMPICIRERQLFGVMLTM